MTGNKIIFLLALILIEVVFAQSCGQAKGGVGNVIGGSEAEKNHYPWIAALFRNVKGKNSYFCGGVIVSENKILTAAHCIQNKKTTERLTAGQILVIIGGHDLNETYEIGREMRSVKKIHVHTDWNPHAEDFDADIAVLELQLEISFNNFIQPICLWDSFIPPSVSSGIIIGYGKSEDESKPTENIPKTLDVPFRDQLECFLAYPKLASISSKRTFCAGSANGAGACFGDSGGGLYVKIQDYYYLRGIVSSSQIRRGSCDVNAYSIYTDVLKHKNFIKYLKKDQFDGECGTMSSSSGLIQKGSFATRKEFPWMAIVEGNFRTSGALISNKHVVSILSAVGDWDNTKKAHVPPASVSRIKVTLGVLRPNDEYSVALTPSSIIFHPNNKRADNLPVINIALITLSTHIDFNEYVKPICLWKFNHGFDFIEEVPLYAVGYGNNENGVKSNARKFTKMTVVPRSTCEAQFDGQLNLMKETKTFCAIGSEDGGQPCHQDESIFMKHEGRWYWRGFSVIRFYLTSNSEICSLSPILYEDVAQYTDWLQSYIEN